MSTGDQATDIFFCEYDRLTGSCPVQRLTAQMGSQKSARIDEDWVVWEDERHGSTAIYGFGLPEIRNIRIPRAREGKRVRLRVRARDPMGGPLTLSLDSPEHPGMEFKQTVDRNGVAKGELNWHTTQGQAGTYILTFAAEKPGGLTVRKSVQITVRAAH